MGSFGKSSSNQSSASAGQSYVWNQQVPFLTSLYQRASELGFGQQGQINQMMPGFSGPLMGAGQQALGGLGRGLADSGFIGAGGRALGDQRFLNTLAERSQIGNPFAQQQIGQFGEDIGRFYREQLLPGIGAQSQMAGQLGGSRQGIAQGLAAQGVTQQFARGATQILNDSAGQALQAAQAGMSGQLGQGMGLAQVGGIGNQAGQGLINSLAPLFNLGLAPYAAEFAPLMTLAGILGSPTVLSSQQSRGSGSGSGFKFGIGS